jgi:enoyl-CoA hydratase/carnithine racemase
VLLSLRSAPKPTIALVDGSASGGGVGLAAACDLVICTERASFAFPEVLFGLVPAMVLPLVLERMSPQRARLWALTGLAHGPEEALAAGLADVVIPSAALERELKRWLRKLARGHVRGVAELKRLTETLPLSLEQAIERGLQLTASALDDEAVLSAIRSFLDDGTPPWED